MPGFVPSTSAPTHPGRFRSTQQVGPVQVGGAFLPDLFGGVARQAIEMAFGADLHADPETWVWYDVTRYVLWTSSVSISHGRLDEGALTSPADCGFVLRDDNGDFNANNVYGSWYPNVGIGVPVRCRLDVGTGWSLRFQGETSGMSPSWDTSRNFAYVTVSAKGKMHSLEQGNSPVRSALYRALPGTGPIAYWSMEDGSESTSALNSVAGGAPLVATTSLDFSGDATTSAVSFAAGGHPGGSADLPDFSNGARMIGAVPAAVSTSWRVEFSAKHSPIPTSEGAQYCAMLHVQTATGLTWELLATDEGNGGVYVDNFSGTNFGAIETSGVPIDDGYWHRVGLEATQSGADINIKVYVDGTQVINATYASLTFGAVTGVVVNPGYFYSVIPLESFGHLAVWAPWSSSVDTYAVHTGYLGETASDRLARLCDEEGIRIEIHGSSQQTMGPQSTATFMSLLRECEAVDNGLLYDGFGPGLSYTCIDELYNAAAALVLDASDGQVIGQFAPLIDDQRARNRFAVSAPDGSSFTFEKADGPHGIDRVGVVESSATVNVENDADLAQQAAWRVWLA